MSAVDICVLCHGPILIHERSCEVSDRWDRGQQTRPAHYACAKDHSPGMRIHIDVSDPRQYPGAKP